MSACKRPGWGWVVAGLVLAQAGCASLSDRGPLALLNSPADDLPSSHEALPPSLAVKASLSVAQTQEKNGNEDAAREQYEAVLRQDPDNLTACRRLAVLYDNRCEFGKADALYRKAARALPRDADLFNDWGYSYYLRNNWAEAARHLQHAVELDPRHARAQCNLGLCLGHLGRYNEALQAFRAGNLSEGDAHTNLAFVYWTQGKLDEARRECLIARQNDPFGTKAVDMLAKLNQAPRPAPDVTPASPAVVARSRPAAVPEQASPMPVAALAPPIRTVQATDAPVYRSPNGTAWVPVKPCAPTPPPVPAPSATATSGSITFD